MKIDVVCSSGSPVGVSPDMIEGRGVGGAELALMTLMEVMARRGHKINVYNSPKVPGEFSGVCYQPLQSLVPTNDRDALIVFRTSYKGIREAKGKKIFWSCDQFTDGGWEGWVFPHVDHIVTISPFHAQYFANRYGITEEKMTTIGLGVRTWEYAQEVVRKPHQCIYCSVPERGLNLLRFHWPRIVKMVPDAQLIITADYRLWGSASPLDAQYRLGWVDVQNVNYLGKVSRSELVRLQLESAVQAYPCIYDELFCIAVAECQVAGAIPVTSEVGAVSTTNIYGLKIPGDPRSSVWGDEFVAQVVHQLIGGQATDERRALCQRTGNAQFNWDYIAQAWEAVLS